MVSCRWLAFKPPGIDRSGNAQYGYLDDTSLSGLEYVWREGLHIGGLSGNPPADTLAPLYAEGSDAMGYVMWNDEPGKSHCVHGCTSFILGHSKGVLAFNASGGFLLSHSVPKFPDSPAEAPFGGIQPGQLLNGQNFACVSLDAVGVAAVGLALQVANLYIYSPRHLPANLTLQYTSVAKLLSDALSRWGPVSPVVKTADVDIQTAGGERLQLFAKSSTGWVGEALRMWEDVVETNLSSAMAIQSWPEGFLQDLPSFCGPPDSAFESLTVSSVSIPGTWLAWKTRARGAYRDHSKWAVGLPASDQAGVFCAGDNNRAVHQSFRGGTALCFVDNTALHAAVSNAVSSTVPCSDATAPAPAAEPNA